MAPCQPEIVIVGVTGTGKSHLLESLLGIPFNYVDFVEDILFSMTN
jgi:ABC-type transport system involved in cytochrome bd biosynthesis fused ATPase/permease subunit